VEWRSYNDIIVYNARIEQAVTAIIIQTRIREELGSDPDRDTCYPEIFSCFFQPPQTNIEIRSLPLPYKLFQIHQLPYQSSVYIVCLSVCLSVRPSIYLSIYGCTVLVDLGHFFSFLIYTQSVGLLGWGISPSQDRYLQTEQHKHKINAQRHPHLEWDSNPRSQPSSGRK
jgi:hypothetical protein